MSEKMSQCQVIGMPRVRTWSDYREGCIATYGGGHHDDLRQEAAFQHGMMTVFNLLEAEFPPAEQCQALLDLIAIARKLDEWEREPDRFTGDLADLACEARTALAKAGVGGAK